MPRWAHTLKPEEFYKIHKEMVQANYEDCFKAEHLNVYPIDKFEDALKDASKLASEAKVILDLA